jgi:alpha-D-ribose 1-methylphosphonate 5-triphosphate diphosphatase
MINDAQQSAVIDKSTYAQRRRMDLRIERGQALVDGHFVDTTIHATGDDGTILAVGSEARAGRRIDAEGLLVLPGIVDIHGDAFERQMMPRPGVDFPIDIALIDSDRQAVANGITTIFHGVTWSWEGGLRGPENARALLDGLERLRPQLAADTRYHLRHETYNLDAEPEITEWLARRRIDVLAFNDHMESVAASASRPAKRAELATRAGLSGEELGRLVERVKRRGNEVPGSVARLAAAALASGVPLLSHDDSSPEQRRWYRSLGCHLAEFPTNLETTRAAAAEGDAIVLGAPNVVRGGSHTGWTNAAEMVAQELCSVLASDYYYPAPLLAAFRLASDGVVPLAKAWTLVAQAPAAAVGLGDRGRIASGQRADLILVDAQNARRPQVIAAIVAGRIVHLVDAGRLSAS